MIDCSFCRALRLASDCSCLSLAMRLSRFLCANPAYPHPLDLPGRPHGQCPDCPTGLLPLVPDLEAGKPACHTPPDAVVVVFVAQRRRGRCARSWFNAFVVVVLVTQCLHWIFMCVLLCPSTAYKMPMGDRFDRRTQHTH